jgi:hypothetical protein
MQAVIFEMREKRTNIDDVTLAGANRHQYEREIWFGDTLKGVSTCEGNRRERNRGSLRANSVILIPGDRGLNVTTEDGRISFFRMRSLGSVSD